MHPCVWGWSESGRDGASWKGMGVEGCGVFDQDVNVRDLPPYSECGHCLHGDRGSW